MALGNNASLAGGRVKVQWAGKVQESKGDDFDYVFQENLALTVLEMMERWAKEWD